MSVIEWDRERRRILLPAIILAPFPSTELTGMDATALIDTGSSVSGVATSIASQLGLIGLGKRPLTSAQGLGQVQRYTFRVGLRPTTPTAAPEFPYVFEEVVGIELTNAFQFDALLGMDILGQCDFSTDRSGHCRLSFGR